MDKKATINLVLSNGTTLEIYDDHKNPSIVILLPNGESKTVNLETPEWTKEEIDFAIERYHHYLNNGQMLSPKVATVVGLRNKFSHLSLKVCDKILHRVMKQM